MAADSSLDAANSGLNAQTVREIARISIGGHRIRVRLSNAYGSRPLIVGAAHVALHGVGPAIVAGSDRTLTFNGQGAVTIPAGALVLSDPVELTVAPLSELAVSLYFPVATGPVTWHELGMQTTFISPSGDATAAASLPIAATSTSLYVLSGVEVTAGIETGAVVTLGDSITDGYGSTVDAQHRWPNFLAQRLNDTAALGSMAVLDQGISGNRLLHDTEGPDALARFDRDVLAQPGVTHLIVLEGINDIGMPGYLGRPDEAVSSEEIIGAYRQLILRAHAKGIKVYGATLTPFEDSGEPYYSAAGEAKREAVNAWIRSQSEFDAVLDFDRLVRDPTHPTRLLPAYDSGDHLHPSDTGYQAMADSIDLHLLRTGSGR
jgi:lysophospholipase L1-like esterase